jgi:hypothetical protein
LPDWIETYRHGELQGEWHETRDPDIWPLLDRLLRDAPELYRPPGQSPRGRGPVLQREVRR